MRFPIGFVTALAIAGASGQDLQDLDRRTLIDIRGVRVYVGVAKALEDAGLMHDVLRTNTELRLRKSGIPVLDTDRQYARSPGHPMLIIAVEGVQTENAYGYSIQVALSQSVLLARNPGLKPGGEYVGASGFPANTWETTMVGVEIGNPSSRIREVVKDLVDKFINAYLAVNLKA